MNNERKDELGKLYIFTKNVTEESVKELEIQEIVFLIFITQHFKKENKFSEFDLDSKLEIFLKSVSDKIRESKELYIIYNSNTNYPHVDYEKRAWIFSKEEFAEKALNHFKNNGLELKIKKIENKAVINEFVEFHRLGIEAIIIDNGQYSVDIKRDVILKPMNYDGVDKVNIPVTNPELNYAMLSFFQEVNSKANYENKGRVISILECKMMEEISKGEYLVPMKIEGSKLKPGKIILEEETKVNFAVLEDSKGELWIPAFTDWIEFRKYYDKEKWNGSVLKYDRLVSIIKGVKGANINPFGLKVELTEKNIEIIDKYRKEKVKNMV